MGRFLVGAGDCLAWIIVRRVFSLAWFVGDDWLWSFGGGVFWLWVLDSVRWGVFCLGA